MNHSVCFIGHREINDTSELRERLQRMIQELIDNKMVNFIFGDHSAFDDLCYETVTKLKEEYPVIRRINFRRNYEDTDDYTMQFLMQGYEESICPKRVGSAGRTSYVERNRAMIQESDVCIFYYDESYLPPRRTHGKDQTDHQPKSGTALAYAYAVQKKKQIYNLFRT